MKKRFRERREQQVREVVRKIEEEHFDRERELKDRLKQLEMECRDK